MKWAITVILPVVIRPSDHTLVSTAATEVVEAGTREQAVRELQKLEFLTTDDEKIFLNPKNAVMYLVNGVNEKGDAGKKSEGTKADGSPSHGRIIRAGLLSNKR